MLDWHFNARKTIHYAVQVQCESGKNRACIILSNSAIVQ